MRSITFIIGPWLFLKVFGWFINPKNPLQMPGAPYYLAGALLFTAMLMSTRIKQSPAVSPAQPGSAPPEPPPEITATGAAPTIVTEENI
jgi:DHA1 family tetracycline resistance protein-like MFS transporter